MYFRIKTKYDNPFSTSSILVKPDDLVPRGAMYEAERKNINANHAHNLDAWTKAMNQLKAKHSKETGSKGEGPKQFAALKLSSCIMIPLRHGDLVVMDGADLQKYYEVSPSFIMFMKTY